MASALAALGVAMAHPALAEVPCRLAVVFDSCTDDTSDIVRTWSSGLTGPPPLLVTTQSASVGVARRIGCTVLLRRWRDRNPRHLWLATTDADSEVPPDWLAVQMRRHDEGYDLWAGRVAVVDSSSRPIGTAREWSLRYDIETAPIHGASLGCNQGRYLEVGGYQAVRTGEDRALHRAVTAAGGSACYRPRRPRHHQCPASSPGPSWVLPSPRHVGIERGDQRLITR